jgi:hypothetical protein
MQAMKCHNPTLMRITAMLLGLPVNGNVNAHPFMGLFGAEKDWDQTRGRNIIFFD